MHLRGIFAGLMLAASITAFAGPTGLVSMPIADILGHREFLYENSASGNERNVDKSTHWAHALQCGFFDIAEFGYDNDYLGHTVLSAKIALYSSPGNGKYAVSAGLQNIGLIDGQPDKYLVCRCDMKKCRLHSGVLYNDRNRLMLGVDAPVFKISTLMIDYISGPHNYTWLGVSTPTPIKGLAISLCAGIPSVHADGFQNSIRFDYSFKL